MNIENKTETENELTDLLLTLALQQTTLRARMDVMQTALTAATCVLTEDSMPRYNEFEKKALFVGELLLSDYRKRGYSEAKIQNYLAELDDLLSSLRSATASHASQSPQAVNE